MRKSLPSLLPALSLPGLLFLAIAGGGPAAAESEQVSCLQSQVQLPAGPIDLDKIPAKPVAGAPAVTVADECDEGQGAGIDEEDDDGAAVGLRFEREYEPTR